MKLAKDDKRIPVVFCPIQAIDLEFLALLALPLTPALPLMLSLPGCLEFRADLRPADSGRMLSNEAANKMLVLTSVSFS